MKKIFLIIIILLLSSSYILANEAAAEDSLNTLEKAKEQAKALVKFLKEKMDNTIKLSSKKNQNQIYYYDYKQRKLITITASRDSVLWNKIRKLYEKSPNDNTPVKIYKLLEE
ncbi:MAG: hypothetical protein JXA60_07460 [Candidatus Coatesbacteria bacterium]|nr:hypothetical protein [Candidatus Coatesbacteria bacterium]